MLYLYDLSQTLDVMVLFWFFFSWGMKPEEQNIAQCVCIFISLENIAHEGK